MTPCQASSQASCDDNSKRAPTGCTGFQPFLKDNEKAMVPLVPINIDSQAARIEFLCCRLQFYFI